MAYAFEKLPVYGQRTKEEGPKVVTTLGDALRKIIPNEELRADLFKGVRITVRKPEFVGNKDISNFHVEWVGTMSRIGAFDDLIITRNGCEVKVCTSPENPNLPSAMLTFLRSTTTDDIRAGVDQQLLASDFFTQAAEADPFAGLRPSRRVAQEDYVNFFKNNPTPPHKLVDVFGD
jgi:hypothetical protein